MAKQPKRDVPMFHLVGPDGRPYKTTDRVEVTNLRARGYTLDKETKVAEKPGDKAS